jgi:hypothetical protein
MPSTIEQWIKRRSEAAVSAGLGEWINSPETAFGKPIYRVADGPVTFVLSEFGFTYDGPPASFECGYSEAEDLKLAPLTEIMPRDGDLLPRSNRSRLLTLSVMKAGDQEALSLQFSLRVYNQVASVLPRILDELASPA